MPVRLLLVAATVLGCLLCLPQLTRLLQVRRAAGVAVDGMVAGAVNYLAWTVWMTHSRQWPLLAANLPPTVIWLATTVLAYRLHPTGRRFTAVVRGALPLPFALTAAVVVAGWTGFTLVLAGAVAVSYGPAAWTAWRARDLTGLSWRTWLLCLAEALCWGGCGLLRHSGPLLAYGLLAGAGAGAVLAARTRQVAGGRGCPPETHLRGGNAPVRGTVVPGSRR